MPNSWFRFKQFLVKQDKAAMKVTTDACIFGAWIAQKMTDKPLQRCLDIGTGTGLLSLMLAQKIPATIDAVDIDEGAIEQAKENVKNSAWREMIAVHQSNIFSFDAGNNYDLIFCNPPFYERSLRSPIAEVNLARHESEFSLRDLFALSTSRLVPGGFFAVLLPFSRMMEALTLAELNSLHLVSQCLVRQSEKHDFFRVMFIFSPEHFLLQEKEEMTIRVGADYSIAFRHLLGDYYLNV